MVAILSAFYALSLVLLVYTSAFFSVLSLLLTMGWAYVSSLTILAIFFCAFSLSSFLFMKDSKFIDKYYDLYILSHLTILIIELKF